MSPQCLLTPFTTTLLAEDHVPAVISFSFVDFHIENMKYLLVQITVWGLVSMGCGKFSGVQQSGALCPTCQPAAVPLPACRRAGPESWHCHTAGTATLPREGQCPSGEHTL